MASATESAGTITLTCDAGNEAVARATVTTTQVSVEASFSFTVARRPIVLRVGSTAGGQQIVPAQIRNPKLPIGS